MNTKESPPNLKNKINQRAAIALLAILSVLLIAAPLLSLLWEK